MTKFFSCLFLIVLIVLGGFAGRLIMIFGLAWDDRFEKCILTYADIMPAISRASWAPVIGSILGFGVGIAILMIGAFLKGKIKNAAP